jgi:hypothetical protein
MKCLDPLPDGGPCHSCRIFHTLIEAEAALGNADAIDYDRCLEALQIVVARFLADLEHDAAAQFLSETFQISRTFRAEDKADPLAQTEGSA